MRVLIIGCGYIGLALGGELARRQHTVFGLRRSSSEDSLMREAGVTPLHCDITQRQQLNDLAGPFDWVVNTASSGRAGLDVYRKVYLEGTRNLMDWLGEAPPRKYVYTSSTGVYSQNDGSTVTESSPALPDSETGKVLRETEEVLLHSAAAVPVVVLRVAGIYGPGRGYFFQQYLKGQATIAGKGERHLNMIHRDDVAGAIRVALERGTPGQIYNVVDDEPVRQVDFFRWLSGVMGRPMPPFVEDHDRPVKRAATNKRISNQKLRTELGYELKYPTFREGYGAMVRSAP